MLYEFIDNSLKLKLGGAIGIEILGIILLTFLLTVVVTRLILPILRAKKLNQPINVYVSEHAGKAGTPTMGGICFMISSLVVILIWMILEKCGVLGHSVPRDLIPLALTLCLGVANGLIGFIDDYKKLTKKQNGGLSEKQKLVLQTLVASAYLCMMGMTDNLPTAFGIPFTDLSYDIGWFAYPLYLLAIIGFVNSTNITDGLDGLASSIGVSVSVGIIVTSVILNSRYTGIAAALLLGALLGFLVFNRHPAKIFMGDTGSLFIGGIIMGCAISDGILIAVLVMSIVFIFEIFSSLLQRYYYKLTKGKRIFKKAPAHHHFQALGWSEVKIVLVFLAVSFVCVALGVLCAVA